MSGNRLLDEDYLKICEKLNTRQIASIIEELENKSCNNCNNDNCQVSRSLDVGTYDNENHQGYCCPMWFNPVLVGRSKSLKK